MKISGDKCSQRESGSNAVQDDPSSQNLFAAPFANTVSTPVSLHERRSAAMNGSPLERATYVGKVVIHTDIFVQASTAIEALMERSGTLKEPGGLRITGEGGTGKSFIAKSFIQRYPREETAWHTYCPILAIELKGTPTPRQFVLNFLANLGYRSVRVSQSTSDLVDILVDALPSCSVKLIMIDEAHRLIPSSGWRKNKERLLGDFGEIAKDIYDRSSVPFVWSGTPSLSGLFEIDKQLRTRWAGTIPLEEYRCDETWRQLLDVFDEALPMEEKCGLGEPARSNTVHQITKGNFRVLKVYLSECVRIASGRGARAIADEHFELAQYALAL
jgi:hypothetical protein